MLERPIFSYVPERDSEFVNPADEISEQVESAEDVLERLAEVRDQDAAALRARFAAQREKLAYFVANVQAPYAADRILDELETLDLPQLAGKPGGGRKKGLLSEFRWRFRRWRRNDQERIERRRQKFPSVTAEEARLAVGSWVEAGIFEELPRVDKVGERLLMFH